MLLATGAFGSKRRGFIGSYVADRQRCGDGRPSVEDAPRIAPCHNEGVDEFTMSPCIIGFGASGESDGVLDRKPSCDPITEHVGELFDEARPISSRSAGIAESPFVIEPRRDGALEHGGPQTYAVGCSSGDHIAIPLDPLSIQISRSTFESCPVEAESQIRDMDRSQCRKVVGELCEETVAGARRIGGVGSSGRSEGDEGWKTGAEIHTFRPRRASASTIRPCR